MTAKLIKSMQLGKGDSSFGYHLYSTSLRNSPAAGPSDPNRRSSGSHGETTPRNDGSPNGARPKHRRSSELAEHIAEAMATSKPEKEYVIIDAATAGSANGMLQLISVWRNLI